MIHWLFFSLIVAVWATVWVNILTDPGHLFDWWPDFLDKITKAPWVRKITWECVFCVAGQLALWSYLAACILGRPYSFLEHLNVIVFSIFLAGILTFIFRALRKQTF